MKIDWKSYFLSKLYVVGFVFALIGWFLLAIVFAGPFFIGQMDGLESFLQSNGFVWGLRIFVFSLVISVVWGKKKIKQWLVDYPLLKTILKTIYIGGATGWVIALGAMLLL